MSERERDVPPEALLLSLLSLLVASVVSALWPHTVNEYASLVWILAIVPPFLLAYHKGWRGAALGLAAGMTVLVGLEIAPELGAPDPPPWAFTGGLTVMLIAVSMGAGWLAEALHRDQRTARRLAYYDALTGLPNRRYSHMHLARRFAEAKRREHPVSVVVLDLDGLKNYNDSHGHAAGDWALRLVARGLARSTRRMDLSARVGGDEFLCVVGGDAEAARSFEARVREAIAAETDSLQGPPPTVSSGIATFHPSMPDPESLVDAADRALYAAKTAGGGGSRMAGEVPIAGVRARKLAAGRADGEGGGALAVSS